MPKDPCKLDNRGIRDWASGEHHRSEATARKGESLTLSLGGDSFQQGESCSPIRQDSGDRAVHAVVPVGPVVERFQQDEKRFDVEPDVVDFAHLVLVNRASRVRPSSVGFCGDPAARSELVDDDEASALVDHGLDVGIDVVGEHEELGRVLADSFVVSEREVDLAAAVGVCALTEEADRTPGWAHPDETFHLLVDSTEQGLVLAEPGLAGLEQYVHLVAPCAPQVAGGLAAGEVSRDAKLVAVREGLSSSYTVQGFFRTRGAA